MAIFTLGAAYASVPLYRLFCQVTGYGGTTQRAESYLQLQEERKAKAGGAAAAGDGDDEEEEERLVRVSFTADVANVPWEFKPCQDDVMVKVGDTVLAFYRARNLSDKPVVGVATYNVTPMLSGVYFRKIQCFCFDQQRLLPHEEVDMPVFFFLDELMEDDMRMDSVDEITLSYTFFRAEDFDDDDDDEEEEGDGQPAET